MIRFAILGALLWTGCGHRAAWMEDESSRIGDGTRCDPFEPQLPAARGIAVVNAPPLAAPWRSGESYDFDSFRGRKARLGKVSRRPPRVSPVEKATGSQP
jgi:hypothetical protein